MCNVKTPFCLRLKGPAEVYASAVLTPVHKWNMSHPYFPGVTFAELKKLKKSSVDGGGIRFDVFSSSKFASAGKY